MTETLPPDALATSAVPRPVPPATGMITSAPWATNVLVIDLPLFWSVKLSAKRAVLLGLVPAEHLDVLALLLVVVRDAVGEAVHEDGHRRDLQAAEGGHLAGLRVARGQVAGEERGLVGGELHRVDVGRACDACCPRCRTASSGFSAATFLVALPIRPPTARMKLHFCVTNRAGWARSRPRRSTPRTSARRCSARLLAACMPAHAEALNDRSSMPPVSVTMQALYGAPARRCCCCRSGSHRERRHRPRRRASAHPPRESQRSASHVLGARRPPSTAHRHLAVSLGGSVRAGQGGVRNSGRTVGAPLPGRNRGSG